jgi:hypothetical protein
VLLLDSLYSPLTKQNLDAVESASAHDGWYRAQNLGSMR